MLMLRRPQTAVNIASTRTFPGKKNAGRGREGACEQFSGIGCVPCVFCFDHDWRQTAARAWAEGRKLRDLRTEAGVEFYDRKRRKCGRQENWPPGGGGGRRDTAVLMDEARPVRSTTLLDDYCGRYGQALKALVRRMYWDEKNALAWKPLGDFFSGSGALGDSVIYESAPLAVAPNRKR